MGTTVPFTRLPASPGAPSSPSRPTSPWVEEEMGDVGHQQPSHMAGTGDKGLLPAWGGEQSYQALWDSGDGHQGHDAELAHKGEVPCHPPGTPELGQRQPCEAEG